MGVISARVFVISHIAVNLELKIAGTDDDKFGFFIVSAITSRNRPVQIAVCGHLPATFVYSS